MTLTQTESREQTLGVLSGGDRFLLVTHEHPDGDAIGSLLAMKLILETLGKDVVSFIAKDDLPLSYEYQWLDVSDVADSLPADLEQRIVVFLDCGNTERSPIVEAEAPPEQVLNIDHHHDNTRFGGINHVVEDASSTSEVVWDLASGLGVTLTPAMAEPLYVGLITDTGRFMYPNVSPRTHQMAAELVATGIDANLIFRRIYECLPEGKLHLFGRALTKARRFLDGQLTLAILSDQDFAECDAPPSYTEGIVDFLRAVDGTRVAALIRETTEGEVESYRVSMRSSDGSIDVSRIARAGGGGGHAAAAGFKSELDDEQLIELLCSEISEQL
jgi:phosphoesterase RecJ-like protein